MYFDLSFCRGEMTSTSLGLTFSKEVVYYHSVFREDSASWWLLQVAYIWVRNRTSLQACTRYMTPILAKTLDASVYTLSFCESFVIGLFRIAYSKICYISDTLWGLSFWHVSSCQLELQFVSSVNFKSVPKRFGSLYVHDCDIWWIRLTKRVKMAVFSYQVHSRCDDNPRFIFILPIIHPYAANALNNIRCKHPTLHLRIAEFWCNWIAVSVSEWMFSYLD